MRWLAIALCLAAATPAAAKKKKQPAAAGEVKKGTEQEKLPRPDDKGQNEGAQGRRNATEDAARQAEHPSFDHRP